MGDVYELLALYYEGKGDGADAVDYMKLALTNSIRVTGTHTERTGIQYYRLAEKQLKYG